MKKLFSLLLCIILLLGLAACKSQPSDSVQAIAKYTPILDIYRSLLQKKQAGEELVAPKKASGIEAALYDAVNKCTDATTMGYAFKDLDNDASPELVLLSKNCTLYTLLTLKDGSPVLVRSFANALVELDGNGTFWYMEREEPYALHIETLQNGSLVGAYYYYRGSEQERHYFKVENGVETEITWQEYRYVIDNETMGIFSLNDVHITTKDVGFYFQPALEPESQERPPLFTVASYDDVLTVYKRIAQLYSDYDSKAWANGDYDDLYSFTSQADYEMYHALFCSIMDMRPYAGFSQKATVPNGQNAYCYSLCDLNGDGIQELLLMMETYRPIAIFTQSNGVPVLLDHYSRGRSVYIDGQGRLIEEKATGGDLGRDREFFVHEIKDGALACTLGLGAAVNIYLEFEGWYKTDGITREPIGQEEWETLYASYPQLPQGCNQAEYNLLYANLTLTRLFDAPVASEYHVRGQGGWWRSSYMAPDLVIYRVNHEISFGLQISPFEIDSYANAVAVPQGDKYVFDQNGFKGEMTVGAVSIILHVTECKDDPDMNNKTFIFDHIPEA